MKVQREQFYYGNNAVGSLPDTSAAKPTASDHFFRSLKLTPQQELSVRLGEPTVGVSGLIPVIPSKITPPVNFMTQKYGSSEFNATTPIAPSQSTVRRGYK
jgi:hypothetical protein